MLRALCLDGSGDGNAKTSQMLEDLQIETRRVMPLKAWGGQSSRRTGNSEVIEVRSTKQTVGRLNSCTRIASFDRVYIPNRFEPCLSTNGFLTNAVQSTLSTVETTHKVKILFIRALYGFSAICSNSNLFAFGALSPQEPPAAEACLWDDLRTPHHTVNIELNTGGTECTPMKEWNEEKIDPAPYKIRRGTRESLLLGSARLQGAPSSKLHTPGRRDDLAISMFHFHKDKDCDNTVSVSRQQPPTFENNGVYE